MTEKRIRIIHILNTGKYSGAENVVITLIKAMPQNVESIYVSPDGMIRDILELQGIKFVPVSKSKITYNDLKEVIKALRPDLIHAHDFSASIIASIVAKKIPVISHIHSNPLWIRKIGAKSILYGLSCMKFAKVFVVSDVVKKEFIFSVFFKSKIKNVGNPIDINNIIQKSKMASDKRSSDIVFLGRLAEPKNPLFFIQIIHRLVKQMPDLKVFMIGDGDLRNEINQKIIEYHLEDNIQLLGFLDNPYGLLENTKILCMPSKWEGFGLAALEALVFGKPVYASNVGGLKEIVNDTCGMHCDTIEQYVNNIIAILNDDNMYREKSEGGFAQARRYDNVEQYSRFLFEEYRSILR